MRSPTLFLVGTAIACGACLENGWDWVPLPIETPSARTTVAVQIETASNPNTNKLCDDAGDDEIAGWTGIAEALLETGETLRLGDPALASSTDFAYAECFDATGACVADGGTAESCELFFFHEGTRPGGHPQYAFFVLHVPAAEWAVGPIDLLEPTGEDVPHGFAIVQIDGDEDGSPEVEQYVGLAFEGNSITLSEAGVYDGEPVVLDPVVLTLTPPL